MSIDHIVLFIAITLLILPPIFILTFKQIETLRDFTEKELAEANRRIMDLVYRVQELETEVLDLKKEKRSEKS